ncbi:MAG TPA: nuclear transport factor 2 family protein [Pseudonocardiaceae bacterium]|jgi:ketosteroid isomerase-like protein
MTRSALLAADQRFFDALTAADHETLDKILAEDFLIVDIHSGSIGTRAQLLALIRSGELVFPAVLSFPEESVVRTVGEAGIVVGRTRMRFTGPDDTSFHADSRYTHVYASTGEDWQLISAQGTQIRVE